MSAQMLVKAWETPGLTPAERLVLLALADCADRFGRNAFKSETTIADHTRLSLRTVKRAIQALKVDGHITVQELPTNRRSTTYQLFAEYCAALEASEAAARRGDNVTPPRQTGSRTGRGDTLSPLEVTREVTRGVTLGVTFRDPYKEEPVDPVEPVEPAVVSILTKFAAETLANHPQQPRDWVIDYVTKAAQRRRLPHARASVEAAVDRACAAVSTDSAISEKTA